MKPIPFAEINRELVPKDPLERAQFGATLLERCRQHHNAEPTTPEGKQRRKTLWLPRIRAAANMVAEARMLLPPVDGEADVRFDRHAFINSNSGKSLIDLIDIDRVFWKRLEPIEPDFDPLENFTTYSVLDPNNRFTITPTRITATNLSKGEDAWVYKDFGTGHFGDFTHLFETKCFGYKNEPAFCTAWAVSNIVDDGMAWYNDRAQALGCFWYYSTSRGLRFYLQDYEDGHNDQDCYSVSLNTTYYMTAERRGTSGLLHIYSNSSRSTLLDTLAVTLDASRTYRYLFTIHSHNASAVYKLLTLEFAYLDLQEAPAFQAAWAEGINTHHF